MTIGTTTLGPLTFDEEFNSSSISLYQASTNPTGRWKTCYWFGYQPCINATSRDFGASDPGIASDAYYNGINPFSVANGAANLTTSPANPLDPLNDGKSWGFGMLTTQPSFSQLYGYFEIRAMLPAIIGTWPAFWMLPANLKTPEEIDIFENLGVDPTHVLCTAHWQDGSAASSTLIQLSSPVTQWHTYGLLWTAETLVWYIDGAEVKRTANHDLHDAMYMIVNNSLGTWAGGGNLPIDASRITNASMSVDYVHAYALAS